MVVVADIIVSNGIIVAGITERDAVVVIVAGTVACNGVVAGKGEGDAVVVVTGIVACDGVIVAGFIEEDACIVVVAYFVV